MPDLDVSAILAEYDLRATGPAVPLVGGEDNRNLRIGTDGGEVVLRAYRYSGPEKVRAELRLVSFLAEHGYPTPAPLRSRGGEVLVLAGSPVAVFALAPGEVPETVTEPLAERMGELLGRMHQLTVGWADARIATIDRLGLIDRALASRPDLDGVAEWHAQMRRFLDDHGADLAHLGELPTGPLHHDLHRHNLLVAGGAVTAVLDFDELNQGPLVLDLARALQYLALDRDDRRLPRDLADAVVAGYDRTRELTAAERRLLPVALDLVGIVDAAGVLMWAAPELGLRRVDQCHSWVAYLRNAGS
ncbi:phosphotransferase enzyme family protein [Occultella gossypii]|uniref:Phosphotransferase n=1 Tax=Occultella gossypii TaxID=2800820 RepID=A0ABS7SFW8_9MICO|nr:phosphotransferase [Occultella gossypii]MBZ2198176.1 phosphotransferase [Occultella gossypii]